MSDQKTFSGSILRVFEARAKPGCVDALAKKFATTSVDVVKDQSGNQGHFFGKSISGEDDVLVFVSVWKDLSSVKNRFATNGKVRSSRPDIPNSSKGVQLNISRCTPIGRRVNSLIQQRP
jgi:hypothetical protein